MKIKLDENLSKHLKGPLTAEGHVVWTSADEGLLSRPDIEIGTAAKNEGMMLFTLDLEFADLRKFPAGSHPGVVLFRPRSMGPLTVNRFVLGFVLEADLGDLAGCVVIVEPNRIRIRRPDQ